MLTLPEEFLVEMRARRERKGWSTRTLAAKCGISHQTIFHYETGRNIPSFKNWQKWVKALGFDPKSNPQKIIKTVLIDAAIADDEKLPFEP